MNEQPTEAEKLAAVSGDTSSDWGYAFKVPPVTHAAWTAKDWVRWIDGDGRWYRKVPQ
jgi:hypothetical protein